MAKKKNEVILSFKLDDFSEEITISEEDLHTIGIMPVVLTEYKKDFKTKKSDYPLTVTTEDGKMMHVAVGDELVSKDYVMKDYFKSMMQDCNECIQPFHELPTCSRMYSDLTAILQTKFSIENGAVFQNQKFKGIGFVRSGNRPLSVVGEITLIKDGKFVCSYCVNELNIERVQDANVIFYTDDLVLEFKPHKTELQMRCKLPEYIITAENFSVRQRTEDIPTDIRYAETEDYINAAYEYLEKESTISRSGVESAIDGFDIADDTTKKRKTKEKPVEVSIDDDIVL